MGTPPMLAELSGQRKALKTLYSPVLLDVLHEPEDPLDVARSQLVQGNGLGQVGFDPTPVFGRLYIDLVRVGQMLILEAKKS